MWKFWRRIFLVGILLLLSTGCIYDVRDDLSEESRLAYDFTVALLEQDDEIYNLVVEESSDRVDEWFDSVRASKCLSPQILTRGLNTQGDEIFIQSMIILCQGSDPICGRIEIEKLYFSEQIIDGEKQLRVARWWDNIQLCESEKYYNEIVVSPLPYLSLKTYD